jgi:hypothetical protein
MGMPAAAADHSFRSRFACEGSDLCTTSSPPKAGEELIEGQFETLKERAHLTEIILLPHELLGLLQGHGRPGLEGGRRLQYTVHFVWRDGPDAADGVEP